MSEIKISIPAGDTDALVRAAEFFEGLALDKGYPGKEVVQEEADTTPPSTLFPSASPASDTPPAPATPPPPAAATAPAAAPAAPAVAGEVDAAGRQHDERIHVGTKTKMNSGPRKGQWKYKPRANPVMIAAVEAELDASAGGAQAPAPAATVPTAPPASAQPEGLKPEDLLAKITEAALDVSVTNLALSQVGLTGMQELFRPGNEALVMQVDSILFPQV